MVGKAILYAAKSTEDKRGSLPNQLADGRAMAGREGWEVAAEYQDEAASGWSGDRGPGLAAALEHAEQIGGVLVVQHSDRLARGDGKQARHLAELYFWAMKAGVEIRSVEDDSTFSNPILAVALGERNAEDSRRKSESVKKGMKRRAARGLPTGGPRPYGYRYGENGAGLEVIAAEAAIVRRIFAEYIAGTAQLAITRNLRADGVPTARGGEWHQGTVRAILANPVYAGFIGDQRGVHEPIVDEDTWAKAEALRAASARVGRGRHSAGRHLFRKGMLRCECGAAMVPRTSPNRASEPTEVYLCYGRKQDPASCSMGPVRRELIDNAVYGYFERVGLDVEATRRQLGDERNRKLTELQSLRDQAEREAKAAESALERVRRDYQRGVIEAEDWAEQRPQLREERDAARAEASRLAASLEAAAKEDALLDAEQETYELLADVRRAIAGEVNDAAGVDAVRAALSRLFDRFILHPADRPKYALPQHTGEGVAGTAPLLDVEGHVIELWVREQAFAGYGEAAAPILHREPLPHAANNYADGLPSQFLFGPISVGVAVD